MARRMGLNRWNKLRWQILERDKYTCQYCGQSAPDVKLEVDHKVSLADGGTDDPSNLVTSCWSCNNGKSRLRESIILHRERESRHKDITIVAYRQTQVWNLLKENPSLTTKQVSQMCNITPNNANTTLKRLHKKGKASRRGHIWNAIIPSLSE